MTFEDLPEKNSVKSNSSLLDKYPSAEMFANNWDGKGKYLERPLKKSDPKSSSSIFGTDGKPGVYCLSKDRFIYSSSSVDYYKPGHIEDHLAVYIFSEKEKKFIYAGSTFCISAGDARSAVSQGAKMRIDQLPNLTKIVYDRAYKRKKKEEISESLETAADEKNAQMIKNLVKNLNLKAKRNPHILDDKKPGLFFFYQTTKRNIRLAIFTWLSKDSSNCVTVCGHSLNSGIDGKTKIMFQGSNLSAMKARSIAKRISMSIPDFPKFVDSCIHVGLHEDPFFRKYFSDDFGL